VIRGFLHAEKGPSSGTAHGMGSGVGEVAVRAVLSNRSFDLIWARN